MDTNKFLSYKKYASTNIDLYFKTLNWVVGERPSLTIKCKPFERVDLCLCLPQSLLVMYLELLSTLYLSADH